METVTRIWKPLRETDLYEASNDGLICNSRTGRILKGTPDAKGNLKVNLMIDGKSRTRYIHRLVVEAFYGIDCSGIDIYHKDGDKLNNSIDNLIFGSHAEIMQYAYRSGNVKGRDGKRIICTETGKVYDSIIECSRKTGISRNAISRAVNNPTITTNDGLHFVEI